MKPLADVPEFTGLLLKFSNPVAGILAGTILTAIIQSSSASVGILQALCMTGAVPFSSAFPIIMGQNIGTCVTALLSAIGANKNAKRAAMIHLYFNLIGTVVFMILFLSLIHILEQEFRCDDHHFWYTPQNRSGMASHQKEWEEMRHKMQTEIELFSKEAAGDSPGLVEHLQAENRCV